jgi:amino acid adenylation domain-containing protein
MESQEAYVFPASSGQKRLWFLDQLQPGTSAFNLPIALRVQGDLNTLALEMALQEIVNRHESLRTTFDLIDGQMVQLISPQSNFVLQKVSLDESPESIRENVAEQRLRVEVKRPFDLKTGPLFRGALYTMNPTAHLLLLNMHHIVADGWSFEIILRELGTLYDSYSTGNQSPLSELPIQYADYAQWQLEYLSGEAIQSQLEYWKTRLDRAPRPLELPVARPRPSGLLSGGVTESILLPESLVSEVKNLSRNEGCTPFMLTLAAFKTLLYRYTGQGDLVIGSPVANRNQVEVEELIGFFVNTLLFRTQISSDLSFRELLSRVRETCIQTFAHQDVPFEKLVEELQPEREANRNPYFETMFIYQKAFIQPIKLPDVLFTPFRVDREASQLDMTFFILEREEGVRVACEYSTELFDTSTIRRFLGHYKTLLESAVANPDQKLSQLPLLTEAERRQMLVEWNATEKEYPTGVGVHELIEQQVERTPDAIAVAFENQRLSYRELNARANQLARYLKRLGVGPDVLVGVCLERSLDLVTTLLGILKAGGAYVPLDPTYPQQRLSFMLKDAAVNVLLTQQHLLERLPGTSAAVLCLDRDWVKIERESDEKFDSRVQSHHLAYVIYTSGSTGKPKGAMIPHRGLINYLHWCTEAYKVAQGQGSPVHSPLGFDLTVTSLLSPLLAGKTTVLLPEQMGVEALTKAFQSGHNFSLVKITPAHLEVLNQLLPRQDLDGKANALIIGGEALLTEKLSFWRTHAPRTRLINEYGPTETVVGCCVYEVEDIGQIAGSVPIGKPIANTQLYILDDQLQPVPIGVPGQLHIAGAGLARGYLNRDELTAEKFILNPFSTEPGARMYRTGDLARYQPDGNIDFLGRMDSQVKVRGYRIELGEIEAAISQHRSVREALVVVREDERGDKRLVAYMIPKAKPVPVEELKNFLQSQLPGYMVPTTFVEMVAFPLTENGKIDRRALPENSPPQQSEQVKIVAPRNQWEQQLLKIWEELFKIQPISVTDDFFELAGHSLMAVRMFSQIKNITGKNLPLAKLFEAPTIEQLARLLQEEVSEEWSAVVPINPNGSKMTCFCIHAGGGNVLFYKDLAKHLGSERPFYGIQPKGLDGKQERHFKVEDMADYYIKEMKKVQPHGPYFVAGASFGGLVAYEMAIQLRRQGEALGMLALFDTYAPGYAKPLPGRSKLRIKISNFTSRVEHHVDTLRILEPGARWPYIVTKATKAKNLMIRSYRNTKKSITRGILKRLGQPLPETLRETQNAISVAARTYHPQQYPGVLTLFRATKQPSGIYPDPTLGWGELVTGKLDIHEVPGSHGTLVVEPRVRHLVEKLDACLESVESYAMASSVGD